MCVAIRDSDIAGDRQCVVVGGCSGGGGEASAINPPLSTMLKPLLVRSCPIRGTEPSGVCFHGLLSSFSVCSSVGICREG